MSRVQVKLDSLLMGVISSRPNIYMAMFTMFIP